MELFAVRSIIRVPPISCIPLPPTRFPELKTFRIRCQSEASKREEACKVSRRRLISVLFPAAGFGSATSAADWMLPRTRREAKAAEAIRYRKLESGVKVEDIIEGEGPEAYEGSLVEFNYVCRRTNGYFVHSTVNQFSGESNPIILPLDDKEMIQGLKDVLIGMKVGGKRRALIPPSAGYVSDNLKPVPDEFGPRRSLQSHAKEALIFEVQLLKVL